MYETIRTAQVPSAEGWLWQSEDGCLGIFLANYGDKEIPYAYGINPEKYGLHADCYQLTHVTPDGTHSLTTMTGVIKRKEILSPQMIKVIELSPVK
jgi:hypothetical protein